MCLESQLLGRQIPDPALATVLGKPEQISKSLCQKSKVYTHWTWWIIPFILVPQAEVGGL